MPELLTAAKIAAVWWAVVGITCGVGMWRKWCGTRQEHRDAAENAMTNLTPDPLTLRFLESAPEPCIAPHRGEDHEAIALLLGTDVRCPSCGGPGNQQRDGWHCEICPHVEANR